ncbi:MAG: hypothetical protein U1E78_13240 [Gammaproteobacteria bacterium]
MKSIIYIALLALSVQNHSALAKGANELYRYKDKTGQTVVDSVLPPEYANNGYEIISERGGIIKTVAPKRTEADIAKEQEALAAKKAAEEAEKEQLLKMAEERRKDEVLLMSFSSEKDIEESKNGKISSIEVLENITKDHTVQLTKQLDEARTAAANYERMGRGIPENILKTIEESKRQIQENERFLVTKAEEKSKITVQFQQDLARFKVLKAKATPSLEPKTSNPSTQ